MRKIFVIMSFILFSAGYCAASEDTSSKMTPVVIPLVEPVKVIDVAPVKAPVSFLTDEQLKDLKEKEALPSIEDIQTHAENTLDAERLEQTAITDTVSDKDFDGEDVIELDVTNKNSITEKPYTAKNSVIKSDSVNSENFDATQQNYQIHTLDDEYSKKTVTYTKEKQVGHTTFGAKYDTSFTPDEMSQKRTLYTKYNATDKFSVNAAYSSDGLSSPANQAKGTVSAGPEYKFNKQLSVKNTYSRNIGDKSNKEEVSLDWSPKKYDQLDIKFGTGCVQYDDGGPAHTQMNVGTIYRF